jgi:pyruvate/2-oxoglutarate dehydrogenase complex dihydrolipoamide acyltransferase (E2) component
MIFAASALPRGSNDTRRSHECRHEGAQVAIIPVDVGYPARHEPDFANLRAAPSEARIVTETGRQLDAALVQAKKELDEERGATSRDAQSSRDATAAAPAVSIREAPPKTAEATVRRRLSATERDAAVEKVRRLMEDLGFSLSRAAAAVGDDIGVSGRMVQNWAYVRGIRGDENRKRERFAPAAARDPLTAAASPAPTRRSPDEDHDDVTKIRIAWGGFTDYGHWPE